MQIVQIHSHCKVYQIIWRCVVLLDMFFIRLFCILYVSLPRIPQGDRGQHIYGPRKKVDKDRQSCPSYWHCGVVRINGYLWRFEKEKSARKRKWKFTVKIFTPFDVNDNIFTFSLIFIFISFSFSHFINDNMVKIWTFPCIFNACSERPFSYF